jgi:hypothetical protein
VGFLCRYETEIDFHYGFRTPIRSSSDSSSAWEKRRRSLHRLVRYAKAGSQLDKHSVPLGQRCVFLVCPLLLLNGLLRQCEWSRTAAIWSAPASSIRCFGTLIRWDLWLRSFRTHESPILMWFRIPDLTQTWRRILVHSGHLGVSLPKFHQYLLSFPVNPIPIS